MERHLAAIHIADVVGYSRLSQIDEEGTRDRFQVDMNTILQPCISQHNGRLVKTMGDGLLVEFHSVVDAVRCAVEMQRKKASQQPAASLIERLNFRIGINLGDVIVEGDDIHGDSVNIAARIQGLAEPGGIVISGTAFDQVQLKLNVGYTSMGSRKVKNIAEPVRVYRVVMDEALARREVSTLAKRRIGRLAVTAAVLGAVAGVSIWLQPWMLIRSPALIERFAYPLPDKPSVAV